MKQRHPQARQKMSRIIDEIGAALFACGATEVSLRLKKEPEGLRLLVQSDYTSGSRSSCSPKSATRRLLKHSGSLQAPIWRTTRRSWRWSGRF